MLFLGYDSFLDGLQRSDNDGLAAIIQRTVDSYAYQKMHYKEHGYLPKNPPSRSLIKCGEVWFSREDVFKITENREYSGLPSPPPHPIPTLPLPINSYKSYNVIRNKVNTIWRKEKTKFLFWSLKVT